MICCQGKLLSDQQKKFSKKELEKTENDESQYQTGSEKFFATKYAPNLLSNKGRASVIVIWFILILASTYGLTLLQTDWNKDFFIPRGSLTEDFTKLLKKYYNVGGAPRIVLLNEELDFASEDLQYHLLDFYEKLEKSYLCEEQWVIQKSLISPYLQFRDWVSYGQCPLL